ncbi:cache domain-containing protein [Pigmentibacter sp. JX0631]|uniref:cache domain-containing protein n=1 Tax=Pigmentibacter sp. JX0631 TaxID=2976982 RepID=UPI0024695ED7|nr:cache domain-containing protein [Pigmentibacter sp. JX0631]WGL59206.1 cache domain-containing protein [Pigmentibacter sp. JX0631]
MKNKNIFLIIFWVAIFNLTFFESAKSQSTFTRIDVEEFVKNAVKFAKENGKDIALKEFMNPNGNFIKGSHKELYIYAYDYNGKVIAHGDKPKLVGINLLDLKDPSGNYPIRKLIKSLNSQDHWVEYSWFNPASKKVEKKLGYCLKVDETWWLGSGIYKTEEIKK